MYALEGADVAIVYLPEEQVDAEKTKAMIERAGRQCLLLPQDIRDEAGCKRIIDSVVQAWGRIDVLVNNASVVCASPLSSGNRYKRKHRHRHRRRHKAKGLDVLDPRHCRCHDRAV